MEQLRTFISWLKRYHFWVLTAVAAIIGLACWYTSAGALGKKTKANQGTIQAAFSKPEQIAAQSFHANPEIIEKQREQIQSRAKTVVEIWQQLYDRQRSQVLKWPEKALTKDFCDVVEKLKFGQEIPDNLRGVYHNYIPRHFDELPKKIQARIEEGTPFGGRGGTRPVMADSLNREQSLEVFEGDYICLWPSQVDVRESLQFPLTPSALKIWVTQEDLWAYHTLLDVIAATNASVQADRPDNAAVRVVESLLVGQKAAQMTRGVRIDITPAVRATGLPAAASAEDGRGEDGGRGVAEEYSGGREGGALTAAQEQVKLLSGRYVNAAGSPIAVSAGLTDYATPFGKEYKRLPVRLILEMDVRSLSYLIAQCANQPLQVEVQEVRINPEDGGLGGGGGRRTTTMMDSGDSRLGTSGVATFPLNPNITRVVIQGVIYIFNEPDPSILKAASGEENGLAVN